MKYDLHIITYTTPIQWHGYVAVLNASKQTVEQYIQQAEQRLEQSTNPELKLQFKLTLSKY